MYSVQKLGDRCHQNKKLRGCSSSPQQVIQPHFAMKKKDTDKFLSEE